MRLVTIVSLATSAVLGVGALFIAKYALPNAAEARGPLATTEAPGQPLVVASRAIKYGEKLEAGMLTVIKAPKTAIPEGGYATVADVLAVDRGGAPVALFPMAPREPVLPAKLSGPGARPSVAAEVADGMRAYTLKVNDASGVGGHALPGDYVDVVLMRDQTPTGPQRTYVSYVVLQNVRVLGIDLNADKNEPKPHSPSTATLEVSVADAQKLSMAATLGELSLALRRTGEAQIAKAPPVRADFLGGQPRASGGSDGPPRSYSPILIIEGESAKRSRSRPAPAAAPAPSQSAASGLGANS